MTAQPSPHRDMIARRVASVAVEQPSRPPRRRGRRPGLTVGRVFGVPLHLNASMLLLALVVTVAYARVRPPPARPRPSSAGYLIGFGFVVSLLGSVLLHELGHALTARRYGIGVRGITLELLGGYTEMDRDAPSPRVELLVSLAGPAVSAVLGAVAVAATARPARRHPGRPARLPARGQQRAWWRCSTACPGCRSTAAGRCAPPCGRSPATGTAAPRSPAGSAGSSPSAPPAVVVAAHRAPGAGRRWLLPLMLLVAFTLWRGAGPVDPAGPDQPPASR